MAYEDVLVHRAVPLRTLEDGPVVDGDASAVEVLGVRFDCCLFLPQGTEEQSSPRGGRQVRRPTLLIAAEDDAETPHYLGHEDEVIIHAPELGLVVDWIEGPVPDEAALEAAPRWQVDGSAQPFGRPGDDVIGGQVALKRIED